MSLSNQKFANRGGKIVTPPGLPPPGFSSPSQSSRYSSSLRSLIDIPIKELISKPRVICRRCQTIFSIKSGSYMIKISQANIQGGIFRICGRSCPKCIEYRDVLKLGETFEERIKMDTIEKSLRQTVASVVCNVLDIENSHDDDIYILGFRDSMEFMEVIC